MMGLVGLMAFREIWQEMTGYFWIDLSLIEKRSLTIHELARWHELVKAEACGQTCALKSQREIKTDPVYSFNSFLWMIYTSCMLFGRQKSFKVFVIFYQNMIFFYTSES